VGLNKNSESGLQTDLRSGNGRDGAGGKVTEASNYLFWRVRSEFLSRFWKKKRRALNKKSREEGKKNGGGKAQFFMSSDVFFGDLFSCF
jgi:hypothetical protein